MADRIFSFFILSIAVGYTIMAFTVIRAPFQYDPLGPEGWPRLIGFVAIPCCLYILARPDVFTLGTSQRTFMRLGMLTLMLFVYAWLFQPAGFIIATFLFCFALSLMLEAPVPKALLFAAATSIIGYFLCTGPLELNLPAGLLDLIL